MSSPRTATVLVILAVIVTGISMANRPNEGDGINITVSPSMLVLSRDIVCVTVHSNILYGSMTEADIASLRLSGSVGDLISPYLTKADSCGALVAKFNGADVKTIVDVETRRVELTLTGTILDVPFSSSDTIKVKQ